MTLDHFDSRMSSWKKILNKKNWYCGEEHCCGKFIKRGVGKCCKGCTMPKKLQKKVIKLRKKKK